jgi:hypothetical protein
MGGDGGQARGFGMITVGILPPWVLAVGLDILPPYPLAVGCDGGGRQPFPRDDVD